MPLRVEIGQMLMKGWLKFLAITIGREVIKRRNSLLPHQIMLGLIPTSQSCWRRFQGYAWRLRWLLVRAYRLLRSNKGNLLSGDRVPIRHRAPPLTFACDCCAA